MKSCYIFGSAEGLPKSLRPEEGELVIAADRGYLSLKGLGITPHLTVGDFDSLSECPTDCEIIRHPVKKDDTDTLLAIKIGLERGFKNFHLYGCAGKRLDHTLANLQALSFIAENGGTGYLHGEDFVATAVKEAEVSFPEKQTGNISLFSATDSSVVSIEGLLYPLEKRVLTYNFPLGVSNEFIGEKAKITVHKGTVIVIQMSDIK